jgi:hypothetical protein
MSEGIWGHSGAPGGEKYIIATPDNGSKGMLDVMDWFRDNVPVKNGATGYKLLYGYYKGDREQSIIFNEKYWGIQSNSVGLWKFFRNQETVLRLGPADARDNRPAVLQPVCSSCWGVRGSHGHGVGATDATRKVHRGK